MFANYVKFDENITTNNSHFAYLLFATQPLPFPEALFLGQQIGKDFQRRSGFRGSSIDEGHCDLRCSEGSPAPSGPKLSFPGVCKVVPEILSIPVIP